MSTHANDLYAAVAAQVADHHHVDIDDTIIDTMLTAITVGLVGAVTTAAHGCITLVEHGQVATVAATDPVAERIDALQAAHHTGPCLTSAWTQDRIVINDYTTDPRWPRFAADVVAHTPIRATASFQLYRTPTSMGALNIHAVTPHAFDDTATALGSTFATQAAAALRADTREEQFRLALASRDIIGQAKGILMHQYDITADAAFNLLKQLSQDTNTKLAVLARRLVAKQNSEHDDTAHRRH